MKYKDWMCQIDEAVAGSWVKKEALKGPGDHKETDSALAKDGAISQEKQPKEQSPFHGVGPNASSPNGPGSQGGQTGQPQVGDKPNEKEDEYTDDIEQMAMPMFLQAQSPLGQKVVAAFNQDTAPAEPEEPEEESGEEGEEDKTTNESIASHLVAQIGPGTMTPQVIMAIKNQVDKGINEKQMVKFIRGLGFRDMAVKGIIAVLNLNNALSETEKVGMQRSGGKVEWGKEKGKQRRASHKRVRKQAKKDTAEPVDEATESRKDIRKTATEKKKVKDGIVYRSGNVVQVWWDRDSAGRPMPKGKEQETWTLPSESEAKGNFKSMVSRWNESVVTEAQETPSTKPQSSESRARSVAGKMGFKKGEYYTVEVPAGWIAVRHTNPEHFGEAKQPVREAKEARSTEPQSTEGRAKRMAGKMGFGKNGYYVMQTPYGWVAVEHAQPQFFGEGDEPPSLSHGGNTGVGSNPTSTNLGPGELTQQEVDVIDTNWKKILAFAKTAFAGKPHAIAVRAIEKRLEAYGIENGNSGMVASVVTGILNKDYSPKSKAVKTVQAKTRRGSVSQGSGYVPMRTPGMQNPGRG